MRLFCSISRRPLPPGNNSVCARKTHRAIRKGIRSRRVPFFVLPSALFDPGKSESAPLFPACPLPARTDSSSGSSTLRTEISFRKDAYPVKSLFRSAVVALLLFPALSLCRAQSLPAAAPASVAERHQALDALFRQYWEEELKADPEFASSIGDKRWNAQLTDESPKAVNARLAQQQEMLLKLASLSPDGLSSQDRTSREMLLRSLTDALDAAQFQEWQMPVSQLGGIHTRYAELARSLSFTSTQDYDDWIARLRALPDAFSQVSENMSIGLDNHRTPPRYLMEKALAQVKALAALKPEDSPFALPLKSFPASVPAAEQERIRTELLAVVEKQVDPAYLRFARFLEVRYIPGCRTQEGAWSLPDGDKYYQFLIRRSITVDQPAAVLHQIGLDQVARDEAQMQAIARQLGYSDRKALEAALKTDPKFHPASPEALLEAYRGFIAGIEPKLPTLFGRLPKARLEVVAIPAFRAQTSAAAYYESGSPDLLRPGRVTVNLYDAASRSLADVEAIAYHEGLPGHHLQIALAQEMQDLPAFRKYAHYTAFTEGWGLYAEHLAKDAGFYKNPIDDYGRLESDLWRSIRLVVDTGVHSQHWTRQQMVDYFHAHSAIDEANVQSEVDRYIAWPAQALGYKIGAMEILALRDRAQKALGARFDLRAFHDQVLGAGALPLDLLEARIDAWIAVQTPAATSTAR